MSDIAGSSDFVVCFHRHWCAEDCLESCFELGWVKDLTSLEFFLS